jgi:hypothetical protein
MVKRYNFLILNFYWNKKNKELSSTHLGNETTLEAHAHKTIKPYYFKIC